MNDEIAKIGAKLNRQLKLYNKISVSDILIGATCLFLKAKLLTANQKHFKCIPGICFAKLLK